jgi:hypothetical protein
MGCIDPLVPAVPLVDLQEKTGHLKKPTFLFVDKD